MPEKKLDLLKLAARIMTESRTRSPEIMRGEVWNVHGRGRLLDDVADRLFRNAVFSAETIHA
jgi:hypothetical protein